jgi:uncharacterized membrane protein YeaQ/YmgE (transglycosylase-associated protein family)
MGIISWIILGLIAGFIGSKIVDRQGKGFRLDIALGIVGALVGGFLFDLFGATGVTGLNIYSMIVAVIGATVVLLLSTQRSAAVLDGTIRSRPVFHRNRRQAQPNGGSRHWQRMCRTQRI